MSGDTALFIGNEKKVLVVASRGFASRGVPTAETEIVVQGSKEAFSESLRTNTMLLRRRIRDTSMIVAQQQIGKRTKTDIALVYIKDLVRPTVLETVTNRLNRINTDTILDIGYLEQFIEDDYKSPFPQCQITERPDKVASAILEGRIAIIADNSPFVMIVPCLINCFFQSPEDYYGRFEIMSLSRILRYFAAIVAVVLPGLYLAIALYSPNMIPTELLYTMTAARANVPFPAIVEILIMDIAFERLRDAGIRLPSAIGSTIGVVGGIIIGQAAVEAGLVSPIVVIIVALTAICGFTLPSISLTAGIRLSKYLLIAGAAFLGLFGFWLGVIFILIHLASLKSFGFAYLFPFVSSDVNEYSDLKDSVIRLPLFMMGKKAVFAKRE
jgi:spore germination protein